ncbi:ABC transporter ATP-binding protein [Pseudoalteromonas luteoviolacea]|uniref:ABC transporter n=1 Tax=Pseudoalteromonas luteoviolacea S4054 TaxID=1129367 RepID=A0A0F6A914_9GAMM|nr:ABC transporter ATP-binding protein [Pseudoalteromonas luteoviolacea]AOT10998.1 ABC transporter ATP-binding protein [Pseudoalteromonas luteoviolacea]AOT15838.1 ABC transporter ATP-binding protein [Pseudoalteromonas luteoviolacea]AOT20819.1 ABC transporter ATP-binding protein [Pseudoalteromonas luteoviolacea]KKE81869.1 ABC transporter [Pseudoalteromonas luteoviolacea S4054]KZN72197.1 ABC transporter [Pseudoalteromonas luteoviolacea S4047-1]
MLRMANLAKTYRTDTIETKALSSFDLEVKQGEFIAVVGPSGSGKTTFLNITGLLEIPSEGQYWLDGVEVSTLGDKDKSRLRNEKIGFIFQSFNLIPELNIYDNVEMPLRYRKLSSVQRKERVEQALEKVGLSNRQKHFPSQLSGGQQQRVAIARALAGSPVFLLADEPTGNLDSKMASGIMSLLKEINSTGTTIIMVTHDLEQATQASRVIEVKDGVISELKNFAQKIA